MLADHLVDPGVYLKFSDFPDRLLDYRGILIILTPVFLDTYYCSFTYVNTLIFDPCRVQIFKSTYIFEFISSDRFIVLS